LRSEYYLLLYHSSFIPTHNSSSHLSSYIKLIDQAARMDSVWVEEEVLSLTQTVSPWGDVPLVPKEVRESRLNRYISEDGMVDLAITEVDHTLMGGAARGKKGPDQARLPALRAPPAPALQIPRSLSAHFPTTKISETSSSPLLSSR